MPPNDEAQPSQATSAKKANGKRLRRDERLASDIRSILRDLEAFLALKDDQGRVVCAAKWGIYAFFDYDDEPIYVGQTYESLRTRIRRHLTNQRTDAVAMHVLDPMEVAAIAVWPFWDLASVGQKERVDALNRAEFAVFTQLAAQAKVSNLLNEKAPASMPAIALPPVYKASIIPDDIRPRLAHSDERIARRAATIANLAQVTKERDVSLGLRQTMVTQAERLRLLAQRRYDEVRGVSPPEEIAKETRHSGPGDEDPTT